MSDQRSGHDSARFADAASSRRSLAVWIWSALLIADAVLVTRRLSGEFVTALPGSLAFLSTVLVAAASWSAWILCAAGLSQRSLPNSRRLIPQGLSVGVTVLWGWSISTAATPLTSGLLLAVILLHAGAVVFNDLEGIRSATIGSVPSDAARGLSPNGTDLNQVTRSVSEGIAGNGPSRLPSLTRRVGAVSAIELSPADNSTSLDDKQSAPHLSGTLATHHSPLATPSSATEFDESPADAHDHDESDAESDENQTLWLSRRLTTDGEQIEGWVRVEFAPGQRETVVHVAFCPPLAGSPEIETEDLDGFGLEIRIAAVFPFGTRLSVRRSGPLDEGHTDRIGFIAQATATNRAA